MEWIDEGIVLSARPHGENAAIVTLLTAEHGRHAGLVMGGQGQRARPNLQTGNHLTVRWRARTTDQLGHYSIDLSNNYTALWLDDYEILGIVASAAAVTEAALPERQPMPGVYAALRALLELRDADLWGPSYVKWELGLLQALGYGLDLTQCAGGGSADDLAYISPRTGRAVSRSAGSPYHDKLFALPAFLLGMGGWDATTICQGLDITGHFLSRHVFVNPHSRILIPADGDLPLARQRLQAFYQGASNAQTRQSSIEIA